MGEPSQRELQTRKKGASMQKTMQYDPAVDDIPDDEKFRLIEESGLFKNFKKAAPDQFKSSSTKEFNGTVLKKQEQLRDNEPQPDHWFQAFLYTIPMCSVYTVMDILVHRQFNEDVAFWPFFIRLLKVAPILLLLIYFTNKHVTKAWVQFLMFLGSVGCGCYLIWVINKVSYFGVMKRCPSLATLWIYFVVQLRLFPAVASLFTVFLYFKLGDPNFRI